MVTSIQVTLLTRNLFIGVVGQDGTLTHCHIQRCALCNRFAAFILSDGPTDLVQNNHPTWMPGVKINPLFIWRSLERALFLGVVVQILPEPSLNFCHAHRLAFTVIGDLVAVDLAQAEISRFRVGKVESAHAGAGPHGK